MLYIISTPIGNIKDISFRAIEILKEADLILAEDTRRTGVLLNNYDIKKKVISYNEKNEQKRIPYLIDILKENKNVALVSDSGTPAVSDPGFKLIREAVKENLEITSVPGACAAISALVCSGLPTDKFSFYGFLTKKQKARQDFFKTIKEKDETIIIYESPYRIIKTLQLMDKIIPKKNVCLCRELTKKFEEFIRGKPSEIIEKIGNRNLKGEIVLVISKN